MGVTESVVGFDAREAWQPYDSSWDLTRRERFLYRFDLDRPCSIDSAVWPSVFTALAAPDPPEKFGYQDTWDSVAALEAATTDLFRRYPLGPFETVAFTLVEDDTSRASQPDWSGIIPPPTPDRLDPAWRLVGYDVADTWATSALSNCGFLPGIDDVAALRRRWAGALNRRHLFAELDEAFAFRDMSDLRLRGEHAPCFVFGVRIIV